MSISASQIPSDRRDISAFAGVAALVAFAFCAAVAVPLATYTTSLALFGLAHVAYEMRYVAWRFAPRLRGAVLPAVAIAIFIAILARGLAIYGFIPRVTGTAIELAAGAILAVIPVLAMKRHRLAGLCIALPFAAGAVFAPIETLLLLAVLHNLSPLAFIADVMEPPRRRRALALGFLVMVALPLLIASGLPGDVMEDIGLLSPEATLFRAGRLDDNIGAYIPESFDTHPRVIDMFSAAVFAQCMHYIATIWLLPKIMREAPAQAYRPPSRYLFATLVAAASLALVGFYAFDYGAARKIYALIALVHAWLEIPVLILALDRRPFHPAST